jgi:hypothetical protein
MFLDQTAFLLPPSNGSGRDLIGQKTVDSFLQKIL